ncbi:hypothetical protein Enr8_18770 [Blastopirellula retiformator]|uniref:Uncharacterized protein n=2 Tax=Blastopirellula retiformator TaxID=2527970 RepID=A0A5C5V7C6_9BACT|nr:hypothetical protein Enr8_18770 [Blastopirellula retiformator]
MDINWNEVPTRFHFFRPAIEACGETMVIPFDHKLQRHVPFWERATQRQLHELATLHAKLLENDNVADVHAWCKVVGLGTDGRHWAARRFRSLMSVLEQLGQADVSPFCDALPVWPDDESADEREETLPEELRYLIGPALHFGERYNCELQMVRFFEEASPEECDQLAQLAERIRRNQDWPRVWQWLRESDWKTSRYHSEIDQLFNLMDLCYFDFE